MLRGVKVKKPTYRSAESEYEGKSVSQGPRLLTRIGGDSGLDGLVYGVLKLNQLPACVYQSNLSLKKNKLNEATNLLAALFHSSSFQRRDAFHHNPSTKSLLTRFTPDIRKKKSIGAESAFCPQLRMEKEKKKERKKRKSYRICMRSLLHLPTN